MVRLNVLASKYTADIGMCVGVWAFVQDYKFYNAEGGKKRQPWAQNNAFRAGAVQGYQFVQPARLEIGDKTDSARELIYISDDSESDQTSDYDETIPMDIEGWIRNTQANQASIQYFDRGSKTWTNCQENLTDEFLTERRDAAGSALQDRDMVDETNFGGLENNSLAEVSVVIPARNRSAFNHLDALCVDVMQMHGNERSLSARPEEHRMDVDYEFGWTGM